MKSAFAWTHKKVAAALMLADGHTNKEVAEANGISDRQLYRWQTDVEFKAEIDRLSVMIGIASRAGRLRIAHKLIRQRIGEKIDSERDLLDWLKFAQSETDGVKSDLASSLAEVVASLVERSDGAGGPASEGALGGADTANSGTDGTGTDSQS